MSTTHTMQLISTDSTGLERWYCPVCGREFDLSWPPNYYRVILREGDNTVVHAAGLHAPGLAIGAQVTVTDSDPRLEPFERWMEGRK